MVLSAASAVVVAGWMGVAASQGEPVDDGPRLHAFRDCADLGRYVRAKGGRESERVLEAVATRDGKVHPNASSRALRLYLPTPRIEPNPPLPAATAVSGRVVTVGTGEGDEPPRQLRVLDVSGYRPVVRGRLTLRPGEAGGVLALPRKRALVVGYHHRGAVLTLVDLAHARAPRVLRRASFPGTQQVAVSRHGDRVRVVLAAGPSWEPPNIRPGERVEEVAEDIRRSLRAASMTDFLPAVRVTAGKRTLRAGLLANCTSTYLAEPFGGRSMVAGFDLELAQGAAMLDNPRPAGVLTDLATVFAARGHLYVRGSSGSPAQRIPGYGNDDPDPSTTLGVRPSVQDRDELDGELIDSLLADLARGGPTAASGPAWAAARRSGLLYVRRLGLVVLRDVDWPELSAWQCRLVPACDPADLTFPEEVAVAVRADSDGRLHIVGRFRGDPEIRQVLRVGERLVAVSSNSVTLLDPGRLGALSTLRLAPDPTTPRD